MLFCPLGFYLYFRGVLPDKQRICSQFNGQLIPHVLQWMCKPLACDVSPLATEICSKTFVTPRPSVPYSLSDLQWRLPLHALAGHPRTQCGQTLPLFRPEVELC